MKKKICCTVVAVSLFGCATIIKGGDQSISIKSNPDGAKFSVYNKKGDKIANGQTPQIVTLKKGAGYFSGETYKILMEIPGRDSKEILVDTTLSGWYIGGNLVFGGLIGWLIVDPLTGAMWTLPEEVSAELSQKMSSVIQHKEGLVIMLTKDMPTSLLKELKPQMKLVN
ncbi:MAG: hypothetical protein HZA78_00455 [Candidatus Schekmanbacteria bacterium]|nr:hypothetical protein [Candidatus Schekmanbacteria bacterium]